jgi:hypothetical protein
MNKGEETADKIGINSLNLGLFWKRIRANFFIFASKLKFEYLTQKPSEIRGLFKW